MAAPIPITYRYNCRCERDTPIRTSPPYPVEAIDAIDVACAVSATGVQLEQVIEFLTSRPYPIEVLEAVETSAEAEAARLLTATLDALDAAADLQSIELRALVQTYTDSAPEAVDAAADLTTIELRTPLQSYGDAFPEAVDASGDLLSISLEAVLVANTMGDEAIDVAADLQSLALVTP